MESVFPEILLPIKSELDLVDKNINKEMLLKAGHVSNFASLKLHWWDKYLHPAVLILSARMFGYNKPQVITMACVVRFIHLATGIHFGAYDQRPGLPVLIGDYFYAKFFSYLCEGEALEWLPEMAQVICDIHDAGVREAEYGQVILTDRNAYIGLIKKQSLLLATCSTFGLLAVKGEPGYELALRTYGLNFGTAIHLMKNKEYFPAAKQLLSEARLSIKILPEGQEKRIFEHLLDFCQEGLQRTCLVG